MLAQNPISLKFALTLSSISTHCIYGNFLQESKKPVSLIPFWDNRTMYTSLWISLIKNCSSTIPILCIIESNKNCYLTDSLSLMTHLLYSRIIKIPPLLFSYDYVLVNSTLEWPYLNQKLIKMAPVRYVQIYQKVHFYFTGKCHDNKWQNIHIIISYGRYVSMIL